MWWWLHELPNLSEYDICPSPSITKFEFSIESDAGSKGYFVYKLLVKSPVISRPFTPAEPEESSTFRELTAVHETWTNVEVLVEFEGKTVGHNTYNKAVVFILGSGSKQPKFLSLRKFRITFGFPEIQKSSSGQILGQRIFIVMIILLTQFPFSLWSPSLENSVLIRCRDCA